MYANPNASPFVAVGIRPLAWSAGRFFWQLSRVPVVVRKVSRKVAA